MSYTKLKTIVYEEILNVDILQYEDIDVEIDEMKSQTSTVQQIVIEIII